MAIKRNILLIGLMLSISLFFASAVKAETLLDSTVTVKVAKNIKLTMPPISGNMLDVKISKGNISYDALYETQDNNYLVFKKRISRRNSPATPETGWTVSVRTNLNAGGGFIYNKTATNQNIGSNPTFTANISAISLTGTSPATGGTPSPLQGPAASITGKLRKQPGTSILLTHYLEPASGDNLALGANLSKWKWDPSVPTQLGDTYACNYMGSRNNPSEVECKKGTTPPPNRQASTSDSSTTPTESSSTESTPTAKAGFNFGTSVLDALKPTATKGCSGTYSKGILKGLPCNGAVKDLSSVMTIIKNIITGFLMPLVGTLFLLVVIYGGFLYITSAGNTSRAEMGKKALTWGVIGLIVVICAQIIIGVFASLIGGGLK